MKKSVVSLVLILSAASVMQSASASDPVGVALDAFCETILSEKEGSWQTSVEDRTTFAYKIHALREALSESADPPRELFYAEIALREAERKLFRQQRVVAPMSCRPTSNATPFDVMEGDNVLFIQVSSLVANPYAPMVRSSINGIFVRLSSGIEGRGKWYWIGVKLSDGDIVEAREILLLPIEEN